MPAIGPRQHAYQILCRVESGAFADQLLTSARLDELEPRDRALVYELVLGVLRHRSALDHEIHRALSKPSRPIDISVRTLLRLGLYQIRFLDRIPAHAAVNESVELSRAVGAGRAAGLVNAVLRKALRAEDQETIDDISDDVKRLAVRYSHPEWLVARWIGRRGIGGAEDLLRADNERPSTFLYIPGEGVSAELILGEVRAAGVVVEPASPPSGCWRMVQGSVSELKDLIGQGGLLAVDRGSQWVAGLLDARPGMRVMDLCAAPGGKTRMIADRMNHDGILLANDRHLSRMRILAEACHRSDAVMIHPLVSDASHTLPLLPGTTFDRVLVDAPCSGTGTLRRNPDIRWRISESELRRLSRLQMGLLKSAAEWLRDGGRLVYSTCSLEPEEGEEVIESFLASHPPFVRVSACVPDEYLEAGYFKTYPTMEGMDGFFAAVLERRSPG